MRALWTVQAVDPGFRSEGVLTLQTPACPMPQFGKVFGTRGPSTHVCWTICIDCRGVTNCRVRQLPADGHDARRHLAGSRSIGRPVNRSENKNAFSLRYVHARGTFATLGIPIKSGRGHRRL